MHFSQKLRLLHRVSTESNSLGHRVYSELVLNCPRHLSLINERLSLEDKIRCHGMTQDILDGIFSWCARDDKADCENRLEEVPP